MKTWSLSWHASKDLESAFLKLLEDKEQRSVQTCAACVGSLQIVDSQTFLDQVSDKVSEQNYDAQVAQLNCTLPVSTLHRDRLLSLHISDTLSRTAASPRDPKEIFRYILGKRMQKQMNLRIDNKGPLRITVVVQHEPTATEHMFLTQVKDPVLKIRKKVKKVIGTRWICRELDVKTRYEQGKTMVFGDSRSTIVDALKALSREEAKAWVV